MLFKLRWKSGDETWTDLWTASRLEQLQQYCDLLGVPSSAELPNKIDESPQDDEIHLSTAEIGASLVIKGRDGPVDWVTDIPVYHNTSSLFTQPTMQGQQSLSFIETKRGRYSTALLDQYKEYEYKDLCNKIWHRTGHHDRILELGPLPQDFSWWASDPESHSISPYFTAVALNIPDHVITKFLKSTQDFENAQAKVKSYSGGQQPSYRTTRGGNPRHTPRHNPISKPPFHDLTASESESSSNPSSPTPTLDIAAMQTVAIQTFQNAIAPQLAAMMGQLSVRNQAIAHSGGYSTLCRGNCSHVRYDRCCCRCNTSHEFTPSYHAAADGRCQGSDSGCAQSAQGNLRTEPLRGGYQDGRAKPSVNSNLKTVRCSPLGARGAQPHPAHVSRIASQEGNCKAVGCHTKPQPFTRRRANATFT